MGELDARIVVGTSLHGKKWLRSSPGKEGGLLTQRLPLGIGEVANEEHPFEKATEKTFRGVVKPHSLEFKDLLS